MEELQSFLREQKIPLSPFDVEVIKIRDIFLWRKKFNQRVTFEVIQKKLDQEETLLEHKKEIPRATLFSSADFNIWEHKLRGVEPGTYQTSDCLTCDGHGEITCPTCAGTGEVRCQSCNGKGQIQKKKTEYKTQTSVCTSCNGTWQIQKTCTLCRGTWQIQTYTTCNACRGMRKIQTGIHPQTKLPVYTPCTTCRASGKVAISKPCSTCSNGRITGICTHCNGSWKKIQNIPVEIEYLENCKHCNSSWRHRCPTCKWQQSIICPTCHGERRTIQYEYNTFELVVSPRYELITNTQITNTIALETIALSKGKKVEYLLPGEKEKLKKKVVEYKMKIDEKTTTRMEWDLYILKEKETWLEYYLFQSKNHFFYKELPPSSKFESMMKKNQKKIENFYHKIKEKFINKIINFLKNRREY